MKVMLRPAVVILLAIGAGNVLAESPRKWFDDLTYYEGDCEKFVWRENDRVTEEMGRYAVGMTRIGRTFSFARNYKNEVTCLEDSPFADQLSSGEERYIDYYFMDQNAVVATTRSWYNAETGKMSECDIWLDSDIATKDNIRKFLFHEWGHCLGLDHHTRKDAIMYWSPRVKEAHAVDYQSLMQRYGHCDFTALDRGLNRFSPNNIGVDPETGETGSYWTLEEVREGFWEVTEYGLSDCQAKE